MSKENERGRHPHPVIFCPMTLQHLFLTSKFPLGYGSLDPDGTWDMGSCLTEKESKAHRESRRGEMNLTVGMIDLQVHLPPFGQEPPASTWDSENTSPYK